MSAAGALVEQARVHHAEAEFHTRAVIRIVAESRPRSVKEETAQGKTIRNHVEAVQRCSDALNRYYADTDGDRSLDLASIGNSELDDTALFSTFYDALKHVREVYRSLAVVPSSKQKKAIVTNFKDVEPDGFSGEEFYGKYVDLNTIHLGFLNLNRVGVVRKRKRLSYLNYLKSFADFNGKEYAGVNKDKTYQEYLKGLLGYLSDFHQRIHPLYPIGKVHKSLENAFEQKMQEDQRIQLFCMACNKQFAKETVYDAHLSGKKHIKNAKALLAKSYGEEGSAISEDSIPLLEDKIFGFRELLKERVMATIQFVESMQSKTYAEILAERTQQDEEEISEPESDDDQLIYNPLKIPLG